MNASDQRPATAKIKTFTLQRIAGPLHRVVLKAKESRMSFSYTNHDAVPAAFPQRDTAPRRSERGTGITTSPPGSSAALIKRKAERQSPAYAGGGEPLDVPQADNARAAGGRGHFDMPKAIG